MCSFIIFNNNYTYPRGPRKYNNSLLKSLVKNHIDDPSCFQRIINILCIICTFTDIGISNRTYTI